jgi:hypothetical protein
MKKTLTVEGLVVVGLAAPAAQLELIRRVA